MWFIVKCKKQTRYIPMMIVVKAFIFQPVERKWCFGLWICSFLYYSKFGFRCPNLIFCHEISIEIGNHHTTVAEILDTPFPFKKNYNLQFLQKNIFQNKNIFSNNQFQGNHLIVTTKITFSLKNLKIFINILNPEEVWSPNFGLI